MSQLDKKVICFGALTESIFSISAWNSTFALSLI